MEYVKQLIADGGDRDKVWAEFEGIATELDGCLCRRLPVEVAHRFSIGVSKMRDFFPDATQFGIFQVLLRLAMPLTKRPDFFGVNAFYGENIGALPAASDNTEDCLCSRLSEESAIAFVEAVMRVRASRPDATTYGVFLTLLSCGLDLIDNTAYLKRLCKPSPAKRRVRVRVRGI